MQLAYHLQCFRGGSTQTRPPLLLEPLAAPKILLRLIEIMFYSDWGKSGSQWI